MKLDIESPQGIALALKGSASGAAYVADRHARLYTPARRGNLYNSSMQAGASLGTALTATAVTLTLYNPSGSPVNLALVGVGVSLTTGLSAAGAASIVLAANVDQSAAIPVTNTAGTVRNNLLGASAGYGKTYTVTTLPAAPVVVKTIANFRVIGATPVSEYGAAFWDNVDGAIILQPNTAVTVQNIGTAVSGIVSLFWEEVSIVSVD